MLIPLVLPAGISAQTPEADLAFHQQASRALAHGDHDAAEDLAGTRDPSDPAAAALRARLLIETGEYDEAEALLAPVARTAPGSVAGLEFGRLFATVGRADEAARFLEAVMVAGMNTPDPLPQYYGGLAAQAAGGFRRANMFFRGASRSLPDDPAIHAAWGDLFLEKYNYADAQQSYEEALAIDREWAPALVGMAQVLANGGVLIPAGVEPGGAPLTPRAAAERALAVDPANARAHLLIAGIELADQNHGAARDAIDTVLETNPSHLEARALVAALAWLEDRHDDFEAEVAEILAINPVYADAYRIAGYHVARAYRFPEAVTLVRRALELNAGPHARAWRSRHAPPSARATRQARAPRWSGRSRRIRTTSSPSTCSKCWISSTPSRHSRKEISLSGSIRMKRRPCKDYVIEVAQEALDELSERSTT